ncbi:sigma-54-dependent Fis family transcriptional regulator [candidate division KSB1 bacterium]|nr:sigma-54-dependent Fis family transcriptional regulator [candidate division KSB1 bacterium]
MQKNILAVDDQPIFLQSLKNHLEYAGFLLDTLTDPTQVESTIATQNFDCVLLDVDMPQIDGISLLRTLIEKYPLIPFIMISGKSSIEQAIKCIKLGAYDFIEKPPDPDRLVITIKHAIERHFLTQERLGLLENLKAQNNIIYRSEAMQALMNRIESVASTEATVLISGEHGTGKQLVAQAIYTHSNRVSAPFVQVNCAAIPSTLLESTLFGHVKGAFTGAVQDSTGKFRDADGGTLFLDEIGCLDYESQSKLLVAIQEGDISPVGSSETFMVDVRIIAATNQSLQGLIKAGKFREDLYYRLNVVPVRTPPLRDRKEDIIPLAKFFLTDFATKHSRLVPELTPAALNVLMQYDWPGNVRELQNMMQRVIIFLSEHQISPEDLLIAFDEEQRTNIPVNKDTSLEKAVNSFEKEYIEHALIVNQYKIIATAKMLNIDRTGLYRKMKKYGIEVPEMSTV